VDIDTSGPAPGLAAWKASHGRLEVFEMLQGRCPVVSRFSAKLCAHVRCCLQLNTLQTMSAKQLQESEIQRLVRDGGN
jgi:hypothetical protein